MENLTTLKECLWKGAWDKQLTFIMFLYRVLIKIINVVCLLIIIWLYKHYFLLFFYIFMVPLFIFNVLCWIYLVGGKCKIKKNNEKEKSGNKIPFFFPINLYLWMCESFMFNSYCQSDLKKLFNLDLQVIHIENRVFYPIQNWNCNTWHERIIESISSLLILLDFVISFFCLNQCCCLVTHPNVWFPVPVLYIMRSCSLGLFYTLKVFASLRKLLSLSVLFLSQHITHKELHKCG